MKRLLLSEGALMTSLSLGLLAIIFTVVNTVEIHQSSYKDIHSMVNSNKSCTVLKDETCSALRDEKISLIEWYGILNTADQC